MANVSLKASLTTMPHELLIRMMPNPTRYIEMSSSTLEGTYQRWLPLGRTAFIHSAELHTVLPPDDPRADYRDLIPGEEMLSTLRALSQTCRVLRSLALPLLWRTVHVNHLEELGRLNEYLDIAPSVAPLIRDFWFLWNMNEDYDKMDVYSAEHGSTLDMAFVDRGALWESAREELDGKVVLEWASVRSGTGADGTAYFIHGNQFSREDWKQYWEPGLFASPENDRKTAEAGYEARGPSTARCGPDGLGEDSRIKDVQGFEQCISQVVSKLRSLEGLNWCCPVTPMPAGVLEALRGIKLTKLRLKIEARRGRSGTSCTVPVWELAAGATDLSLDLHYSDELLTALCKHISFTEIKSADKFPSFGIRAAGKVGKSLEYKPAVLNYSAACRTIVTAARGGRLKRLDLSDSEMIQEPFAVRDLIPAWVKVQDWNDRSSEYESFSADGWRYAAHTIRIVLSHASLCLADTDGSPRNSALLTCNDVQSLLSHFEGKEYEHLAPAQRIVELYLRWLKDDAALAQKVADSWKEVIAAGEANVAACRCTKCQEYRTKIV